jgi:ParB family chromosome partitioning protein
MAARRTDLETRSVGRAQSGRPAVAAAQSRESAERSLPGAFSVPIEQLVPDPGQPRREFDAGRLAELAASLADYGVLQPLVVRESGFLDDGRTQYMIVAGGRRYAAALQAGLTRLPVLVRESEGAQLRILQLTENLQREALPAVDEARALKELMDLEALDTRSVATRLHRSHTYVADRLKLIVHEEVAAAVAHGVLTPSAATEVARERNSDRRQDLLRRAYAGGLQKRDVQDLRRRARDEERAGGEPTLREVAREMGAGEAQIAAAAQARREEPALSVAEALMLAISAPSGVGAPDPPSDGVDSLPTKPSGTEDAVLAGLVRQAGGPGAVLVLLEWAAAEKLPLPALIARVRALT